MAFAIASPPTKLIPSCIAADTSLALARAHRSQAHRADLADAPQAAAAIGVDLEFPLGDGGDGFL
jgi:hypothetical protein